MTSVAKKVKFVTFSITVANENVNLAGALDVKSTLHNLERKPYCT
jgi:hypothetical protein